MAYFEDLLAENTKAVKELTAMMSGGKPSAAAGAAGATPARGPGRPKKVTLAEVKVAAEKVRDDKNLGRPAALALIKQHGADTLAELDESKYAAFIAAAEVLLKSKEEGGDGDEEVAEADL